MVRVGQRVPNFELEVYYPTTKTFGKVSLEDFMRERRWLVLFFYPADFILCVPPSWRTWRNTTKNF